MWGYYAHTKGGEVVLKCNGVHANENMPLLFGNAITKDKSSQRERSKPPPGGPTAASAGK
jgi:hypothetical protein